MTVVPSIYAGRVREGVDMWSVIISRVKSGIPVIIFKIGGYTQPHANHRSYNDSDGSQRNMIRTMISSMFMAIWLEFSLLL